jgi:hypothetical protein
MSLIGTSPIFYSLLLFYNKLAKFQENPIAVCKRFHEVWSATLWLYSFILPKFNSINLFNSWTKSTSSHRMCFLLRATVYYKQFRCSSSNYKRQSDRPLWWIYGVGVQIKGTTKVLQQMRMGITVWRQILNDVLIAAHRFSAEEKK